MKYVFLHGLGQAPSAWDGVIQAMDDTSDITCPALSEWLHDTEPCYSNLYKALEAYCEQLDGPVNLCGLSLGGILALNYAIEHSKRVNALALVETQVSMPKGLLRFQNMIFRLMADSTFHKMGFDKKGVIKLSKSMMNLDFRQDLKQIVCPTLVICGEKDIVNKAASLELKKQIPGAKLMVIPKAGHEVNVDAPAALGECLHTFFIHGK